MKLAAAITTPEVPVQVPVALFSGSFEERLDKAAALGYAGVELMALDPSRLRAPEIAGAIRDRGLEAPALGTGAQFLVDRLTLIAGDADTERRAIERFERLADFAAGVGCPLVTIGSFRGKLAWGGEGARGRLVEALRRCAETAGRRGLRVALEPLNRYENDHLNTVAEVLDVIQELGAPNLRLLADTFHMNIEEVDIAASLRQAGPHLGHVHLVDSNRQAPGHGHLDVAGVLQALAGIGYRGYLSFEVLPLPDPRRAAEDGLRTVRDLAAPPPARR